MSDLYQIGLFGDLAKLETIGNAQKETIKSRFRRMYGFDDEHKCGTCKHLICNRHNNRNYYKCELMGISASEATDIRLHDTACKRWEKNDV